MKKLVIQLIALTVVMMLACSAVLAEEAAVELPESGWIRESVDGAVWQDDRASLEVIQEGDGYKVLIIWASSAWENTEWTYACYPDADAQKLTAINVICDDVVYDENGTENRTTVLDQDCETVFGRARGHECRG